MRVGLLTLCHATLAVEGTPAGTLGLSVCYDLRFPPVYAALRAAGAHTLLVPSAFMPRCAAAWRAWMPGASAQQGRKVPSRPLRLLIRPFAPQPPARPQHGRSALGAPAPRTCD